MKKLVVSAILLVTLFCGVSYTAHNYTREDCIVIQATETGAIFKDKCGFTWYVECEGYSVGDVADLKMYDNGTDSNINDDEVKGLVRK